MLYQACSNYFTLFHFRVTGTTVGEILMKILDIRSAVYRLDHSRRTLHRMFLESYLVVLVQASLRRR